MSKVDEVIKCVTSSNLEKLEQLVSGEFPVLDQFPLGGKWRKNVTLMHLASAYGSLTCIQYFIGKIDINAQTDDGVRLSFTGHPFYSQHPIDTKHQSSSYWRMVQILQLPMLVLF